MVKYHMPLSPRELRYPVEHLGNYYKEGTLHTPNFLELQQISFSKINIFVIP